MIGVPFFIKEIVFFIDWSLIISDTCSIEYILSLIYFTILFSNSTPLFIIKLIKELDEEFFDFYCRKLSGQQKSKTNEKKSINLLNAWDGELVGQEYVKKYFTENDKEKVIDMINNITDIMKVSLENQIIATMAAGFLGYSLANITYTCLKPILLKD